jgi:hypothetical protein
MQKYLIASPALAAPGASPTLAAPGASPALAAPDASPALAAPGASPAAAATLPKARPTLAEEASKAWASLQPVSEASFTAWYVRTHSVAAKRAAKRAAGEMQAAAPPAAVPGGSPDAAQPPPAKKPALGAVSGGGGRLKASALAKGLVASLKASARAKRWHRGDVEALSASLVMGEEDFKALFAGIELAADSPIITSLSLDSAQLKAVFGALLEGISVKTHSRPRSFRKAYPTGAVELSFPSAAGKYSRGTSTVTLKVTAVCGEGSDSCGWW